MNVFTTPKIRQSKACIYCRHMRIGQTGPRCFNPLSMDSEERAALGPLGHGWNGALARLARWHNTACGRDGKLFEPRLPDLPRSDEQHPTWFQRIARRFA